MGLPAVYVVELSSLVMLRSAVELTINWPCAAAPVPALNVVMALVVFVYVPIVEAVTSTLMVQVLFAAIVPGVVLPKFNTVLPLAGAKLPGPQPRVLALGEGATTIAPGKVGNVSLKVTPVMST